MVGMSKCGLGLLDNWIEVPDQQAMGLLALPFGSKEYLPYERSSVIVTE
jgi:hypothetical protein